MKTLNNITTTLTLAALLLASASALAATSSEQLQQGLYAEEVEGNIPSAIRSYNQVLEDPAAPSSHVAQALFRLGVCYMKTQDDAAAQAALQNLVSNHPDQTELVDRARPLLDELADFDPALLMPPDTLMYVELGSPGEQIETLLAMLKGTPYENPLAVLEQNSTGNSGEKSPAQLVSALLNPKMTAEFKKIRGSAIGLTGFQANHPEIITVLYPGESDALAGLIRAGLEMVGTPTTPLHGMTQLILPEDMAVAYDDRVIIAARPASRLTWSVEQYKGLSADTSLVTGNTAFMKLNRAQRRQNALTVWLKVDECYRELSALIPADEFPEEIRSANVFLDFANIDQLLWTDALNSDGLSSTIDIHLKEGHGCLAYNLIQTPNLTQGALSGVPQEAVALMSVSLNALGPHQSEQVMSAVHNTTGLDIGREIFDNLEQVTLFTMPAAPDTEDPSFPFNLGLTLTSRDPDQTHAVLSTVLSSVSGGQQDGDPSRFPFVLAGQPDLQCYLEQADGVTALAMEASVVDRIIAAVEQRQSVTVTGPLHEAVAGLSSTASKLALVNVGGAIRLMQPTLIPDGLQPDDVEAMNASLDELARASDGTTLELRTDETKNRLTLSWSLAGLPPLQQLIDPMMRIAQIAEQASPQAASWRPSVDSSALILPTSQAPVIDGEEDEVWARATRYTIDHAPGAFSDGTQATPLDGSADLSAGFRALWDSDHLYLYIDVTDDQLVNDTSATEPMGLPDGSSAVAWWYDDSVEVYLDADNARQSEYGPKDAHYHFDWDRTRPTMGYHNLPAGVHVLDRPGSLDGVEFAMTTTDQGYRTEIKFPWSTLGTTPAAGGRVGLDIHVNDDDDGGTRDAKISWHDTEDSAWINPQAFGVATLGGLVGWWPFDETTDRTAMDRSGGHRNGTLIGGATWAAGKVGGAVALNGQDAFVRVTDDPAFDMVNQMTLACWVNMHNVNRSHTAIITKGDNAWRLSMDGVGDKLHTSVDQGPIIGVDGQSPLPPDEWHHVAAVYNGSLLTLYMDGQPDGSQPWSGAVGHNDFDLLIGENAERTGRFLNGLVDEVRVYNHALTQDEIARLIRDPETR